MYKANGSHSVMICSGFTKTDWFDGCRSSWTKTSQFATYVIGYGSAKLHTTSYTLDGRTIVEHVPIRIRWKDGDVGIPSAHSITSTLEPTSTESSAVRDPSASQTTTRSGSSEHGDSATDTKPNGSPAGLLREQKQE